MPRRYEPIWQRLKQRDTVRLSVDPIYFHVVKSGIIREKNKDAAFKMMNDDRFVLKFLYDRITRELVIELQQRLGTHEKVVT